MNGNLTKRSKQEWIAAKASRSKLTKAEQERRYNQYLISRAVGGPNFQKKRNAYREGINTGSKGKGNPGGFKKTLGTISECTRDYALAIMDPWDVPIPPCIPDIIVLPSYKFSSQAKGKLIVGTAGCGFVMINNDLACINQNPPGLAPPCAGVVTDASYALTTMYFNTLVGGPNANSFFGDSPLSVDAVKSNSNLKGFKFRPVGCGIRMRYMGKEIDRAGRIIPYREVENGSLANIIFTSNELLQNREASTVANDRIYHHVIYMPVDPRDFLYRDMVAITDGQFGNLCLALFVEGAVAGSSFEFEAVWHWECIGRLLPAKSDSHSDPQGLGAVMQALPHHQPTGEPKRDGQNFLKDIVNVAEKVYSFVKPVLPIVGALL